MPPTRGLLLFLSAATLVTGQDSSRKQLTARELFYAAAEAPAAAQAPAAVSRQRPVKTATRPTRTPPKVVEIARADIVQNSPASGAPVPAPAPAATTAPMPAGGAPPVGLRYTVLKVASDNTRTEVPADSVFHQGDRIRFSIQATASGYLYIINQGSSGAWKAMFPSPEIQEGNNRIEGWQSYITPPRNLIFDATAGTENLFIVFSRQPEADLEALLYSRQGEKKSDASVELPVSSSPEHSGPVRSSPVHSGPVHSSKELIQAANISDSAVDRMRKSYARDLVIESVNPDTPGDKKEVAVYVVNASGSAESRVVADLHLVHQ